MIANIVALSLWLYGKPSERDSTECFTTDPTTMKHVGNIPKLHAFRYSVSTSFRFPNKSQ